MWMDYWIEHPHQQSEQRTKDINKESTKLVWLDFQGIEIELLAEVDSF
jgi:hypothetical protein